MRPLLEHPPLDTPQMEAALHAYWSAREQAWRYVLRAVDPTASDAPAPTMQEVLTRVQAQLEAEMARCVAQVEERTSATPEQEAPVTHEGKTDG